MSFIILSTFHGLSNEVIFIPMKYVFNMPVNIIYSHFRYSEKKPPTPKGPRAPVDRDLGQQPGISGTGKRPRDLDQQPGTSGTGNRPRADVNRDLDQQPGTSGTGKRPRAPVLPDPEDDLSEEYPDSEHESAEAFRHRAIPVSDSDSETDLVTQPVVQPKKKSVTELARESHERYLTISDRQDRAWDKLEQCMDKYLNQ
jgi:hypothetical protein